MWFMAKKVKRAPVVAVLNMKGGVGKTTISAHVFRVLYQRCSASTLLIDLDPQFNLTQTLFKRKRYDVLRANGQTIISVMEPPPAVGLFEVNTSTKPPPPVSKVSVRLRRSYSKKSAHQLSIVPGDFYLAKYSLMEQNTKLKVVKDRFSDFIEKARTQYKQIGLH